MNQRPDPLHLLRAARPPELASTNLVDLDTDHTARAILERVIAETRRTPTRHHRRRRAVQAAAVAVVIATVTIFAIGTSRKSATTTASRHWHFATSTSPHHNRGTSPRS